MGKEIQQCVSSILFILFNQRVLGDLLFASAFGTNVLIMNNVEDADELFEQRSTEYSDRPSIPMAP